MRVEFKRLAMRIRSGEAVEDAHQTLKHLVLEILDRESSADDTDLLCETFSGLDTLVAHEVSSSSKAVLNLCRFLQLVCSVSAQSWLKLSEPNTKISWKLV